jgi:hypothetical protein
VAYPVFVVTDPRIDWPRDYLIVLAVRLLLVLSPPSATPSRQNGMQNTSNGQREDDNRRNVVPRPLASGAEPNYLA